MTGDDGKIEPIRRPAATGLIGPHGRRLAVLDVSLPLLNAALGIPDDFRLTAVVMPEYPDTVRFVLESDALPEVAEGTKVPRAGMVFQTGPDRQVQSIEVQSDRPSGEPIRFVVTQANAGRGNPGRCEGG